MLVLASGAMGRMTLPSKDHKTKSMKAFTTNSHRVLYNLSKNRRLDEGGRNAYFTAIFKHLVAGSGGRVRNDAAVAEFFAAISDDDIERYGKYMIGAVGTYLDSVKNEAKAQAIITSSKDNIIKTVTYYLVHADKVDLKSITPEWLDEAGAKLIDVLQNHKDKSHHGHGKSFLAEMPAAFWSYIASRPVADQEGLCGVIKAEVIEKLSKDAAQNISPACFASVERVGRANIASVIPKMSDGIFKHFQDRISAKNVRAMKDSQLASLGTEHPADNRCRLVELYGATKEAIKSVTGPCLASYLLARHSRPIGALWVPISKDVFESFTTRESEFDISAIAQAISYQDKAHIPVETMNQFLSYPGFASSLTADGELRRSAVYKIAPKFLPELKDKKIFISALSSTEPLDPLFLAYLDSSFFSRLRYSYQGKFYDELRVLDLIKASNKEEVIYNLSSKLQGGSNACSLIKSIDAFKSIKALEYCNPACITELTFDIKIEDYKKVPALLRGRPYSKISKHLTDEDFARMSAAFLAALVTGDFCTVISYKKFSKINPDALSAINSEGLMKFTPEFAAQLTSEQTTRFADGAFEAVDAAKWKRIGWNVSFLNDKQLVRLSSAVKEDGDMVTASFTEKDIKLLDKRVSLLTARQVASLPERTLAIVKISEMPAASLTKLDAVKLKCITANFSSLTPQQIEKIASEGANVSDAMKIIEDNKSKLNKDAFVAWEKRRAQSNSAVTLKSSRAATAVALGIIAALIL